MAEQLKVGDCVIWRTAAMGKVVSGKVIAVGNDTVTVESQLTATRKLDGPYVVAPPKMFLRLDLSEPEDLERWLAAL